MSLIALFPFIKSTRKKPRQVLSESWENRNDILNADVNLFCWKRSVNKAVYCYLEHLLQKELKPIKFHSHIDDLVEGIEIHKQSWDFDFGTNSTLFWDDVLMLAQDFLKFAKDSSGTIHLKVIDNNACSKFHTDGYSLRLFSTYYGSGTQWLPEKATNRKVLGKTNELIVKDPTQIQQMETFEVGILKGEVSNSKSKGIVHKSPAIQHRGEKRIILRIDI